MKAIIFVAAAVLLMACSSAENANSISQSELLTRINNNAAVLILDVRSPEEYRSGHVPGAINIPFGDHERKLALISPAKNDEIIVYCESGYRAAKVETYLIDQGYSEVRHLEGDMKGWRKANYKKVGG